MVAATKAADMYNSLASKDDKDDFDWDRLDELLKTLSAEEVEELNGDFDPDNSLLPPSQRCRDQTSKLPTGPLNRKKLLAFLEKKAKEEKDWEEAKPYTGEKKGKIYVPKEPPKIENIVDEEVQTEWDDILSKATEEELVDLAAVLGFHGMLNQVQYNASIEDKEIVGGFAGVAKAEDLRVFEELAPNTTNYEESLKRLKDNDPKLKHLNLNNIKGIPKEKLIEIVGTLKTNTHLEIFEMASVDATDFVAKALGEALKDNKTLQILNVESNFISGESIVEILNGIDSHKALKELRVENQKPSLLGNKVEMAITKLVEANDTLLRFGIWFEYPDARVRVQEKIQKNNDLLRQARVGKSDS
ncbi:tropomodulin-2 isoform X1 [Octopus bimaculoides]|uniref:Tropomodulin n=2 Tax=Octopus bimaculoides TaxID=37653 RepID=A0A0L8FUN0_OCTBM|nr:tropomodulin-2 isoform X1 [Octopus bimaculoides]|eukprot:XP_014786736.1 PREDICTED: tropomodulin-2-like [Octopus bimaculoides]